MVLVTLKNANYNDETGKLEDAVFPFMDEAEAERFIAELMTDEGMQGISDRDQFKVEQVGYPWIGQQLTRFYELFGTGFWDE